MILERTFSRARTSSSRSLRSRLLPMLVAALMFASPLSAGAEDSKGANESAASATTGGDKTAGSAQGAASDTSMGGEQPGMDKTPAGKREPKTDGGAPTSSTAEPPVTSDAQQPAGDESAVSGEAGAQPKPLPLIPEIQKLPTIKIPQGKLPVAILLPNFEQFHRAFTKHGREYTNKRLSATEALVRAKLQTNGCYIISEEAAHALSQYVIEVYLTRAKTSVNLMAHGYQINGGLSRYRRTPGRLVRIGYNSLGEFDQLYSVDDFEMKVLMLTDVFLDRTKDIRKRVAASAKKPSAKKGK